MKTNKTIICLMCALIGLSSVQVLQAMAVKSPIIRGDTELNGNVAVTDATLIQKYQASLEELTKRQIFACDVDGDQKATIKDATLIQKRVAEIITQFDTKDEYNSYIEIKNFYADYNSSKAMVGKPVTFTTEVIGGIEPFSYEYYVNGAKVGEKSASNKFDYTFNQAGTYTVKAVVYNDLDEYEETEMQYTVVEPYTSDEPVVQSLYLDRNTICSADQNITVTAVAFMGKEPYQYSFVLDDGSASQDFSSSNTFVIKNSLEEGEHTIKVMVKDSQSKDDYVTETLKFTVTGLILG